MSTTSENFDPRTRPDRKLERLVAGSLIFQPDLIEFADHRFGLDVVEDFHAKAVIEAVANLRERQVTVDAGAVEAELKQRGYGDVSWLAGVVESAPAVIRPDVFANQTQSLVRLAEMRACVVAIYDEQERVEAEVDEFALRDVEPQTTTSGDDAATKPLRVGRRRDQIVAEIRRISKEPTLDLRIGERTIARVRPGGIVTLVGGSGRGKTSLAATIALEHAKHVGPAIIYSLELPAYEFGARAVGIECDAGWLPVLEGDIPDERMVSALPERLSIIDRSEATPAALEAEIDGMRAEFPGLPILVVPDYIQLMEVAGAQLGQQRAVTDQAMRIVDRIAREKLVVALVPSQGSRASARALSSGDLVGAQTTDTGAESAAIERWASCTLAIGEHGPVEDDGSCAVPINVGKGRMLEGGGDAQIPARYRGRSGRWWLVGEPQKAAEVRKERDSERTKKKRETLKRSIVDLVSKSDRALSKAEITERTEGNNGEIATAIKELIREHTLVHHHAETRYGHAPIWTAERIAGEGKAGAA